MNPVGVAVQSWRRCLRCVLAELTTVRLRWCLVCGRVGLWGWQPLCAAMPITWVCIDRANCRHRQAVRASRRERRWRRLVLRRRPGPTRPPTCRPWHPAGLAGLGGMLNGFQPCGHCTLAHGAVAMPELVARAEEQSAEPAAELTVLGSPRPDSARSGRRGGWR
jgi:hypothetical protein